MIDLELQNRHFKTDDTGAEEREGSGSRQPREKKEKPAKSKKPTDEEADIQRAIALSKQTAEREERTRLAAAKKAGAGGVIGKRKKAAEGEDFDFGGGFEAGKKAAADANDINDFDFGDVAGAKEEKKEPASDEFDFNFGGGDAKPAKASAEPAAQTGDLLDLLGGLDMNAGTSSAAEPDNSNPNALDFFNDASAKNAGALGASAAQNEGQ